MRTRVADARLGLISLAVAAALVVFSLTGVLSGLFGGEDTRTVRAIVADSQQLRAGDHVRIQGLEAGKVRKTELGPDRRSSIVTMDVKDDVGSLYADAGAIVRWHTVLGGHFYVDLQRGSPARGKLQGTIPLSRTARQTELDDVASVISGDARRGLQTLPGELSDALADPQAPARLLDKVAEIAPDAQRGLRAARGTDLDKDLRVLVSSAAATVHALDAPQDALRRVVGGAATTLETIAARGDDVRAFQAGAPATLQEVDTTVTALRGTLGAANPLLAKLQEPAGQVRATFSALQPQVTAADSLVRRAVPLLQRLRPAVRSLGSTARGALPLLEDLQPTFDRLDKTILPYLAEKDPGTGKSTAVMIGGTFAALGAGAGGQMDANGHFIRFPATVGSSNFNSLPCQIYIANPDAKQLIACQTVKQILASSLAYQPLGPTPGTESP